jgi:hypothetical protein
MPFVSTISCCFRKLSLMNSNDSVYDPTAVPVAAIDRRLWCPMLASAIAQALVELSRYGCRQPVANL